MGLASYGEPSFVAEMEKILVLGPNGEFRLNLDYFSHHKGAKPLQWDGCAPRADDYFTASMSGLLGAPREPGESITSRHKDIACSAQAVYERALFNLLGRLHDLYKTDALVLSGGCAFNSVANGKIYTHTPFRELFVQPAAGDAGGALGAALYSWHVRLGQPRAFVMKHAFFGPDFSDDQVDVALAGRRGELASAGCRWKALDEHQLVQRVSDAISRGQVIGWFQGRMEWGPRALGNRSILADPRRQDIREVLNRKIKRRESFRPFAPAILREFVSEWFETDDRVPFMMKVFIIREEKRESIPAVTHVDGTGRLQTVEEDEHPLFHRLIEAFHEKTGVPMLLNTSFNENEPIVCDPDQAIDCFLRTKMDMLVLGTRLLEREPAEPRLLEGPGARSVNASAVGE
jgi:carbamoyltransferase